MKLEAETQPKITVQRIHGRFEVAAITDCGNVRILNEDGFLVDQYLGLIVIADGMSGRGDNGGNGAEASALAIKSIHHYLSGTNVTVRRPAISDDTVFSDNDLPPMQVKRRIPVIEQVKEAVANANTRIYSLNQFCGREDRKGVGTTLAGLYWPSATEKRMIIFHIGDCRVYRLRDTVLHRLSHDHTAIQKWIDYGLQGMPPAHNQLLRAVGPTANVNADVSTYMLLSGDVILLCSNGLTTMVPDHELVIILHQVAQGLSVEKGAWQMVAMAKKNGGKDNITVALGFVSNSLSS